MSMVNEEPGSAQSMAPGGSTTEQIAGVSGRRAAGREPVGGKNDPPPVRYKRVFVLSLFVIVVFLGLYQFPADDGLRHVGLAFTDARSWGQVYPHSYFEIFRDYDPWLGYDLTLRAIAAVFEQLPMSRLGQEFVLTKVLALLFAAIFLYLILARSELIEAIEDEYSLSLALMIVLVLLGLPVLRLLLIRPFAFGTLFVVYAIKRRGLLRGLLASAVLAFFYPYLAWFYTVPVAVAHFFKGDRRFAFGTLSMTVLAVLVQPASFWGFQLALFKADALRKAIDLDISELHLTLTTLPFIVCLVAFLLLYPLLGREARRLNGETLLLLFYLVPALKYNRYFFDLTLPLLFVAFGRDLVVVLGQPLQRLTMRWRQILPARLRLTPRAGLFKGRMGVGLKVSLVLVCALDLVLMVHLNDRLLSYFKQLQADLSSIPAGALVLTDFDSQFKVLFVRPDVRLIPSCEVGFAEDAIRSEYNDFFNEGKVCPLARRTGAQYVLQKKGLPINPEAARCLQLVNQREGLRVWKIVDAAE